VERRRHTPEQIVRKLREAVRLLAEGMEVPEVAKALEVSEQTYHRWRAQYGGMQADDVKRLKELERENAQLKRLVADKELENLALREISKGRMKVKLSRSSSWRVVAVGVASRRRCVGRRARRLRLSGARAGGVPRGSGL
jgi:putative transposase